MVKAFNNELSTSDQIGWYNDLFNDSNTNNGHNLGLFEEAIIKITSRGLCYNQDVCFFSVSVLGQNTQRLSMSQHQLIYHLCILLNRNVVFIGIWKFKSTFFFECQMVHEYHWKGWFVLKMWLEKM